jgi:hypothetical protein
MSDETATPKVDVPTVESSAPVLTTAKVVKPADMPSEAQVLFYDIFRLLDAVI